jgi:hypothetical protein
MKRSPWIVLVPMALLPGVAAAQVACGDVVLKGTTVTLTADLGPCDGSATEAALTVDGGRLDLGGRTVTCADGDEDGAVPQGIVLTGKKSRVSNGTVTGCTNGVMLLDQGKHVVERVTASGSVEHGVVGDDAGGKNKLTGVTATGNGNDGMNLESDKNKIVDAVATLNVSDGIDLTSDADKNKVTNARAEENGDNGIEIGGDKNKATDCTANDNANYGIVFGGEKSKVKGGTAQGNGTFDLGQCEGNKVKKLVFTTASPDCP